MKKYSLSGIDLDNLPPDFESLRNIIGELLEEIEEISQKNHQTENKLNDSLRQLEENEGEEDDEGLPNDKEIWQIDYEDLKFDVEIGM